MFPFGAEITIIHPSYSGLFHPGHTAADEPGIHGMGRIRYPEIQKIVRASPRAEYLRLINALLPPNASSQGVLNNKDVQGQICPG